MLQAQNLQIEEQFQRHLLATLSAEVQGTQQRSSMNRQMSMGNEGKLSLDLTGLRSPFSDGMHTGPMTSPAFTNNGYVLSPGAYSNQSTQSYIPGMNAPVSPMPNIPSQFPSYIQQAPTWESIGAQQPVGGLWTGVNQRSPGPNMQPSMWQPQTMPLPPSRPRERLGSAPEIPIQPRTSGSAAHSRVNSEPNLPNANTNASDHFGDSGPNSPKQSETQSTSELCPTPTTPLSPPLAHQAQEQQHVSIKEEPDGMFAPTDKLDSAFDEFNHWSPMGLSDESGFRELDGFGMDDLIVWDEFTGMPTLS